MPIISYPLIESPDDEPLEELAGTVSVDVNVFELLGLKKGQVTKSEAARAHYLESIVKKALKGDKFKSLLKGLLGNDLEKAFVRTNEDEDLEEGGVPVQALADVRRMALTMISLLNDMGEDASADGLPDFKDLKRSWSVFQTHYKTLQKAMRQI